MVFLTAGMGGGTGTGATPVVARIAKDLGILTVGVVTKPFEMEGKRKIKRAEEGIAELQKYVDNLIVIPNQNIFQLANPQTSFTDSTQCYLPRPDRRHRPVSHAKQRKDIQTCPGGNPEGLRHNIGGMSKNKVAREKRNTNHPPRE